MKKYKCECGKCHACDYSKPFTVNWLCPLHHKSVHFGEIGDIPTKTYQVDRPGRGWWGHK